MRNLFLRKLHARASEIDFLYSHHPTAVSGILPDLIHNAIFAESNHIVDVGRKGPRRATRAPVYKEKARIAEGRAQTQTPPS